jgi:hypothetical protein
MYQDQVRWAQRESRDRRMGKTQAEKAWSDEEKARRQIEDMMWESIDKSLGRALVSGGRRLGRSSGASLSLGGVHLDEVHVDDSKPPARKPLSKEQKRAQKRENRKLAQAYDDAGWGAF